jgi:fatty acid-binding protein DegV
LQRFDVHVGALDELTLPSSYPANRLAIFQHINRIATQIEIYRVTKTYEKLRKGGRIALTNGGEISRILGAALAWGPKARVRHVSRLRCGAELQPRSVNRNATLAKVIKERDTEIARRAAATERST